MAIGKNDCLGQAYLDYTEKHDGGTWNDFFDYAGVPMSDRSDFACAAILNKARTLLKQMETVS
jgi:hypothetical protein